MHYVDMRQVCYVAKQKDLFIEDVTLEELLLRLGGVEGLNRLHHNAGAMIDIARYLGLMKPEARDLAHRIRQDASIVRRYAKIISWQCRLGTRRNRVYPNLKSLTQLYVRVAVDSMQLSELLVDEILPLLQQVAPVNAGMLRASEIGAA